MFEKEKYNKKTKILGGILLTWFIISMLALIVVSKYNTMYTAMILGQYFFIGGLIPLIGKEKHMIGIPFVVIGFTCIVIPFLMIHPELIPVKVVWDNVIVILFILLFFISGICLIYFTNRKQKKLKKNCTYQVDATIIRLKQDYNDGTTTYCPIYQFWYNDRYYEVSSNVYTNIGIKRKGTVVKLMINPQNPNEFLDENKWPQIITNIIGIFFILLSSPILIYMLTAFSFFE